jgi:CubicO group peptidase (beta-lactamase class C family)
MTGTRNLAQLAVAAVVAVLVAVLAGPKPLHLDELTSGDEDFGKQVRAALGERGQHEVAAAMIDGGRTAYAGFGGADETTAFEIGSVAKALTGMLLYDLTQDGTVRLDQPVGELVPGTPLAGGKATLEELSQHRSGLPRLGGGLRLVRSGVAGFTAGDPYTGTPDDVLAQAADAGAPGGGEPAYSNLGAATLGDALAVKADKPYGALLTERVLTPLAMADTKVVTTTSELPAHRARPASAGNGRSHDPWIASGWAPAGVGVWSTARDLTALAAGILAGTAPGAAAAEPTHDYRDGERIGLGWFTSEVGGRTITWHNGAVGGMTAWIGLDREAGRAVVLLSASTETVDEAGEKLLTGAGSATGIDGGEG